MIDWTPDLASSNKPRYLAIADIIAADIKTGRLATGDRLPPQRKLASRLEIDFTTVARGYAEARKRGLIESRVGQGTYVRSPSSDARTAAPAAARRADVVDFSMNLPPEPNDPALMARMRAGVEEVSRDIVALLRYQGFGGSPADKDAASSWLGRRSLVPTQERIFITPGAHPAILGAFLTLAAKGEAILCEAITYPGARAISAQLGLNLIGLPMDREGIEPDALADACARMRPKALYLNPTLQNPTTLTVPAGRRSEIAGIARRYGLPIIEDDAYGFIPPHGPAPFAALAPDLTWHIAGLAKCIGAGVRAEAGRSPPQ
jgi:DNA-binding transcriptional MocR family regulator